MILPNLRSYFITFLKNVIIIIADALKDAFDPKVPKCTSGKWFMYYELCIISDISILTLRYKESYA